MFKGMFKNPIPEDHPRAVKARARYEAWSAKLSRMHNAIAAVEARKKGAEDTLKTAAGKYMDGEELPEFSDMVREAAVTVATCDRLLAIMQPAHRTERRRDLSPEPHVAWKPKRLHGAPGGPILAGQYEAHFPEK